MLWLCIASKQFPSKIPSYRASLSWAKLLEFLCFALLLYQPYYSCFPAIFRLLYRQYQDYASCTAVMFISSVCILCLQDSIELISIFMSALITSIIFWYSSLLISLSFALFPGFSSELPSFHNLNSGICLQVSVFSFLSSCFYWIRVLHCCCLLSFILFSSLYQLYCWYRAVL